MELGQVSLGRSSWLFLLLVSLAVATEWPRRSHPTCPIEIETCPEGEPLPTRDWTKPTAFDDLSMKEIQNVMDYMSEKSGIPLVPIEEASLADPFIYMVERIHPIKNEVIYYLDKGGPEPSREARVVVFRGDLPGSDASVQEYRVGPLPNPIMHSKLMEPIPFTARSPFNMPEEKATSKFLLDHLNPINHILEEFTGYLYKDPVQCTAPNANCLTWYPSIPGHVETGHHYVFAYIARTLEGGFLYPIGLQMLMNLDSAHESDWTIEKVWLQGIFYDSLDAIINAYNRGDLVLRKVAEPEGAYTPDLSASMNFRGDPLPEEPLPATKSYYPAGRRFKTDGHHVDWLGWQLDFTLRMSQGLIVHDIKYKGERIAYELSMQEIGVIYSGAAPGPAHTNYVDSMTLTGIRVSQLYRGIDCPDEAVFFDFPFYLYGRPYLFKDGVCIFEHDRGVPLRRHYDSNNNGGYNWAQGMRDIVLVTRGVFTVYNYDYIVDIMLHQGGQIEVKASLSGYTINSYYTGPEQDRYGYQTLKDSIANIHQHVLHFKADLDIGGTRHNRLQTLDLSMEEVDDPVYPEIKLIRRFVTRNMKTTEKEAAIKYNLAVENVGYLVQYCETSKNKLGYPRGYRIANEAVSKFLLPDPYRGDKGLAWMRYQVAVTRYNDNETRSSSQYATMEPYNPVVSFQDFIDNDESIVDEDLVSWITLGVHHIPHSEDVPVVLSPGVQLTFFLLPYNYFDEDPSLASRDNIRVTPGKHGKDNYAYSGVKGTSCCKPRTITGNGEEVDCISGQPGHSTGKALPTAPTLMTLIFSLFVLLLTL